MKKRLLSLLTALALLLALLPTIMAGAADTTSYLDTVNDGSISGEAAWNTDHAQASQSTLFSTAHIQNRGASQTSRGTARNLEVVITLKDVPSSNDFFTVVMRKSDYAAALGTHDYTQKPDGTTQGPNPTSLGQLSYYLLQPASSTYYGISRGSTTNRAAGETLTLPLVTADVNNNKDLTQGGFTYKTFPMAGASSGSDSYYDEYVLIVFAQDTSGAVEKYYVDYFYVDSMGYVRTPSYLLRYNANNPSDKNSSGINHGTGNVTNLPSYGNSNTNSNSNSVIISDYNDTQKLDGNLDGTTIPTVTPNRDGYTFVGWTNKEITFDTATKRTYLTEDQYSSLSADDLKQALKDDYGAVFYSKGDPFPCPEVIDKAYDLYALWRVIPIKFSTKDSDGNALPTVTLTRGSDSKTVSVLKMSKDPQVGVKYVMDAIGLDKDTDNRTSKTVGFTSSWTGTYGEGEDAKEVNTVDPRNYTVNNTSKFEPTASGTMAWKFTETTPDTNSNGSPVFVLLVAKDNANNTYDYQLVWFNEIKKGAQITPDLDVNTGLEGIMKTLDGKATETSLPKAVEDALIAELQAKKDAESGGTETPDPSPTPDPGGGEQTQADEGENPEVTPSPSPDPTPDTGKVTRNDLYGSDGYADGRIIGFYSAGQPSATVNGESATNGTGTYTNYYLKYGMIYEYRPYEISGQKVVYESDDAGWREIPFQKDKYSAANLALVESGMGYKAATAAETVTNGAAVSSVKTSTIPAWDATYGWIEWENDLRPVVHGLKTGDVYQVRFKANANYAASATAAEVTIGGAVGTGGNSGPADPSDFVTVVCFDWDDTPLGSVTVPREAKAEIVEGYMETFQKSKMSEKSKDYPGNTDANATYFVDDAAKPLTYKRGYSFYGWIPNDSTAPTHCGRAYNGDNKPITIPDPDKQDFGGLTENITVKACYKDNTELYYTDDPTQLTYTMEVAEYNRIGSTANYIITYRFLRQTTITKDGQPEVVGVPRTVEPQLRLVYNSGIYNFFALDTSDDVTFTAYPNGNTISSAAATMVDFYQASVLTTAAVKANGGVPLSDSNGTSALDAAGFRFKGTLSLVNEELENNSTTYLTIAILRGGLNLPVTPTTLTDAQTNLRAAWVALNSNEDGTLKPSAEQQGLTFDQMNYAIANGGALP